MELLNLTVPKDKCLFDFLAEMGPRCQNAWIFINADLVMELKGSKPFEIEPGYHCFIYSCDATEEYPATQMIYSAFDAKYWYTVMQIIADDIPFKDINDIEEPDCIIRLRRAV